MQMSGAKQNEIPANYTRTHPDEDDVGGLDGDVGAGADGDADVGLGQGRAVVHAVPHHCDLEMTRK